MNIDSATYHFPYARYPAVRAALCLIAGILAGERGLHLSPVLFAVLVLIQVIMELVSYRNLSMTLAAAVRWGVRRAAGSGGSTPYRIQIGAAGGAGSLAQGAVRGHCGGCRCSSGSTAE